MPVSIKNKISTNLSTTKYTDKRVNMYAKNVFLSVFNTFKNLSKYFKVFTTFKIKIYIYIILQNGEKYK